MFMTRTFKTILGSSVINDCRFTQTAGKRTAFIPRLRLPEWHFPARRSQKSDVLSSENQKFLKDRVESDYGRKVVHKGVETYESQTLLKVPVLEQREWHKGTIRCGTIAKKLGHYPLWLKDGKRINTTVLQIVDNHVVKYTPPEEFDPMQRKPKVNYSRKGCILLGAEACDPNKFTGNYIGLFKGSGVMPTNKLGRFIVTPNAQLPPGTPLNVSHYRVGDYIDVAGKTVFRGNQGVMKRWGFKGMPATHGVTKTHRRGGSLSSGKTHGMWKGKKMPGCMGNKWRTLRGMKIWRINTKMNTMWVSGHSIAGQPNQFVYIYDTVLPNRQPKEPYPLPTFLGDESQLPEDIYDEKVHPFGDPTIFFEPEK